LKEVGLDARVVVFTTAVSVLTGVLFGLAPALQVSRVHLAESLKEGARGSTEGGGRVRARSLLVVAEVALSLVLLAGAGLLLRSFERVRAVDPGFDPQNVLTVGLSAARAKYQTPEQQAAFFSDVLRRAQEAPGVVSAGLISILPLSGDNSARTFLIDGLPAPAASEKPKANFRVISPDYFRTMGIALKSGRSVTEHDAKDSPHVIVINEALARRYFPGEDPLGKRIRIETDTTLEPNPPVREVVGVVADVRHESLEAPAEPEYYVPYRQEPERYMEVVARTAPGAGAEALRGAVKAVDREQYVPEVSPMAKFLTDSVARRRFQMLLLGLFAAAALVLAAVGIYGVMSYAVTQRTHEIGVRLALGAEGGDVLRMVVGQGLWLALAGVGVGLLAGLGLARAISGLLYGVSPADPLTFASVSLLLLGVALFSCVVPAWRATRVDPMVALRHE
ncbi:MAG TPA: FtsX-like permease family protein, partial [Pyrinomonadaceae bacterium]|nr:FtsX-like permease family protein [Pyrinomonadaceae bacterium]